MAGVVLAPASRLRYVELVSPSRASPELLRPGEMLSFSSGALSIHQKKPAPIAFTRDVRARAWWSRSKKSEAAAENPSPVEAPPQEDEEEEVEISWAQEKAEELVQLTGNAINSIPGPRVGGSSMPWLLAVPVAYFSLTFVIAVYRTILKYNSPKAKKRRMIGKNAFLVTSLDKYFPQLREEFDAKALKQLERKCDFDSNEVLRKYIRYVMNERPFTPDTVADLIHLRKVAKLSDEEVAEVLNETSRRIVNEKGTVLMDMRGLTERGIKRKAVVRSLFCKLFYLSELDEFCSAKDSLEIKQLFGVTDEDANSLRIETLSELSDIESLDKMVDIEPETDLNLNNATENQDRKAS